MKKPRQEYFFRQAAWLASKAATRRKPAYLGEGNPSLFVCELMVGGQAPKRHAAASLEACGFLVLVFGVLILGLYFLFFVSCFFSLNFFLAGLSLTGRRTPYFSNMQHQAMTFRGRRRALFIYFLLFLFLAYFLFLKFLAFTQQFTHSPILRI
ncbi:MAG: hypothetical protein LBT59_28060 [Clostridiales bacterium]|jgi:hypothetical protein|nr:hypothetical protein [Clostridiales bacterium]